MVERCPASEPEAVGELLGVLVVFQHLAVKHLAKPALGGSRRAAGAGRQDAARTTSRQDALTWSWRRK
jgi:hypothetical protein